MVSFLLTILFIGVVYGTFTYVTIMRGEVGSRLASPKHARWAVYKTKLRRIEPLRRLPPPKTNRFGARLLFALYATRRYKAAYAALVLLDVVHCFAVSGGESSRAFDTADGVARATLAADFALKVIAFGPRHVLFLGAEQARALALAPLALDALLAAAGARDAVPRAANDAFRALRAGAVVLLVPVFPEAGVVLAATLSAVATLLPLLGLVVVVTFVYAVCGAFLYSPRFGFAVDRRAAAAAEAYETVWKSKDSRYPQLERSDKILENLLSGNENKRSKNWGKRPQFERGRGV